MEIKSSYAAQALLQAIQSQNEGNPALQVATLKKVLDEEKSSAAELLKMLQGKGQVVDIRV